MSTQELPIYSWEEIQKHTTDDDCWVVMYDKVLDVSKWLNLHPGGLDPIKDMAGMDITSSFESIGHTSTALVRSKQMIIGRVDPASKITNADKAKTAAPKWSETDKKELLKCKGGGEIIPLWLIVAVLFALASVVYFLI